MKKILLAIFVLLLAASAISAQIETAASVQNGANLPAACSPTAKNVLFYKTGADAGLYNCTATNTWSFLANGTLTNTDIGGVALSTVINNAADLDAAIAAADATPNANYIFSINNAVSITNSRTTTTGAMSLPTLAVSAVNTTANTLTVTNHGLSNGDQIEFYSTGAAASPLVSGATYYVIVVDANTIQLNSSYDYATVSTPSERIDLSSEGRGGMTIAAKFPQNPKAPAKVLTTGTAFFTSTDVGRIVRVGGAGYNNGNLDCPIAAYTSATQVSLNCATGATVTAATVSIYKRIPKNVRIEKANDGKFVSSDGGLLDVQGLVEAPPVELFSGFNVGGIVFSGATPNVVYPEWFGAKGDAVLNDSRAYISGTDDILPFRIMLASPLQLNATSYIQNQSLHIVLSKKVYYLSDTLNIDTPVLLEGLGGSQASRSALKFAANKTGIVLHSLSTNTGGKLATPYKSADFSIIRGITVLGTVGGNELKVSVSNQAVSGTSQIVLTRNSGGVPFTAGTGFQNGNTITIGNWTYVFDNVISPTQVTLKKPRLFFYSYSTANKPSPYIYRGSYEPFDNSGAWLNQNIRLPNNVVYKICEIIAAPAELPLSDRIKLCDTTTGLPVNVIRDAPSGTAYLETLNITNEAARANVYHGIDVRGQVELSNNTFREFAGNGIELNSQSSPSFNLGNVPNINNSVIRRNTLYQNYGNGLRAFGINSNQILIEVNDSSYNKGAGYMEQSLLGNTYTGNHSSYNVFAPTYADTDANSSSFFSEYEEGDGTSSRFGQFNLSIGGNRSSGGGIDTLYGTKAWIRMNHSVLETENLLLQSTNPANPVGIKLGTNSLGSFFSFGSSAEPANGKQEEFRSGAYEFRFNNVVSNSHFEGWYGFQTAGGNAAGQNYARFPLLMSGKLTQFAGNNAYAGRLWLPDGAFIGQINAPLRAFIATDANGLTVHNGDFTTDNSTSPLDISAKNVRALTGDVVVTSISKGVVLKSPDGTCYRITVANGGALSTTAITCP